VGGGKSGAIIGEDVCGACSGDLGRKTQYIDMFICIGYKRK